MASNKDPVNTNIVIREMEAGDESRWRVLWSQYLAFYEVDLAPETTDTIFARLITGSPHFVFMGEIDGVVQGFVHGLPHASTWAAENYCYLEDLYVAPDARGTGIARALIEAVYAEADRRQCARVYWHTDLGNERARSLYDKVATLSDFVQYRRV